MGKHNNFFSEFKVNDYLILRLENNRTNVYIKGKVFSQCKFLLLSIPAAKVREFDDIESIDEAAEKLDSSMERGTLKKYKITPKEEFWGHCSNLQAWYENDYNTRLIHRNLAFPLLRALVEAGDPLAKRVFKEEIAIRLESGYPTVVSYLINQGYLHYLNLNELVTILECPAFINNISKYICNYNNVPKWLYKKIRKLIPRRRRQVILKPDYDATFKIILFGDKGEQKTQLVQRYLTNLFRSYSRMTIGVDFLVKSLEIDGYRVKLQVWDFDGEERFKFLLPTYARGANGALFFYDAANYPSLAHIDNWLMVLRQGIGQEGIFPIIVVGIVSELDDEQRISAEEAIKIAKSRDADGFIECSPRTGENVGETFEALTRLMLTRSGMV